MKQAINLSATSTDAPWVEPRGIVQTVLIPTGERQYLRVHLGEAGVSIDAGPDKKVGIPMAEILKIALAVNPELQPKPS